MEHASTGVPAGTGRLSQATKYAHLAALACGKNALQARWALVLFASLLGVLPSTANSDARLYLPATGPTLLRFTGFANKTNAFRWPPLIPEIKERPLQSGPTPDAPDSVATAPVEPVGVTTNEPPPAIAASTSGESVANTDLGGYGTNSASELLLVTPQMLAEYFQTMVPATNAPGTNVPAGGAIWFTPPSLPAPGSEAIYRVR